MPDRERSIASENWRRRADEAEAFHCFIDPDAQEFVAPGNIPERIQKFCRRTGQPVPETVGETVRCIYESLALKYRYALEQLEGMTGKTSQYCISSVAEQMQDCSVR